MSSPHSEPSDCIYEPLPDSTSIRILILAPGDPDDDDLSVGMITSDLDYDHETFPDSTPSPIENICLVTGKNTGDDDSHFPIRFDMDSRSSPQDPRPHPFQRYEALSYVWGDLSDPQHVFLGGDKLVPVTKSLYSALRSLRLRRGGRKLWVDALCINQSDHEEKKVQLALMKRVYQQAEKVIAYLPLSVEDQKGINELVPKIMMAIALHKEHQDSKPKEESEQGRYTGPFNNISDVETKTVARIKDEPMNVTLANALDDSEGSKLYLESFGLPRPDSPLWDSWRRIFGSPYFRRMWIWQEVTLSKKLYFWFGNGEGDAEPLFLAHHFLAENSAVMNMSYTAAWCASGEDNQDTLNDRLIGSGNATTMLRERILRRYGRGGSERRLIEKLAAVGTFEATDPRDKIYALLGLACDGASFTEHVSYAPWDSKEQIYSKFARLFVERNEGIDVLLQAGLREEKEEWPSWVPHWDNLERPVPVDAGRSPGKTSTRIQVDENSQTLNIYGTILDDISAVNNQVFRTVQVTEDGVDMFRFIMNMVSCMGTIFRTAKDPEVALEQLFIVLAQPKSIPERSQQQDPGSNSDASTVQPSSQQDPSSSTDAAKDATDRETEILRTGFHEFLNYMWALKPQLDSLRSFSSSSESEEKDTTRLMQMKSPGEFQAFQKTAMKNIHHRRMCVTKGERVGLAPKRVKVGDKVVMFEECDIHFVLRPVAGVEGEEIGEETGGKSRTDAEATYRLVGPAFFNFPSGEGAASGEDVQSIRIV
ncbi:HET-domain-containing protein [Xylaria sp. FL0064]|nr:HET-domain-containing protein [Xylaria sp. FL0064]